MYRLNYDYETEPRVTSPINRDGVRSGLTLGKKMYYVGIGREIYYSNSEENGVYDIDSGISHVWEAGEYVGPDTVKVFKSPPPAKHLELYNGRMFGAVKNQIWYTEPFAYSWVDTARDYISFESDVRMIRAVVDGIYVSTETQIFFFSKVLTLPFCSKLNVQIILLLKIQTSPTRNLKSMTGVVPHADVAAELSGKRPFCARIGWSGGGGHFVAITDMAGTTMTVDHPWYGRSYYEFPTFTTAYQGTGAWTHSYYTKSA